MEPIHSGAVTGKFEDGLRSIRRLGLLVAISRGKDFNNISDLIDSFLGTPQMEESLRRFRELPGGRQMLEERYPPLNPDIPLLAACPPGSLGHSYARLIQTLNYDASFFRERDLSSDGHWLTQRIATTHDIHHVISGFGTRPVGENGVLAITATQVGFPAYVLLVSASGYGRFRFRPQESADMARAIAHGTSIGFSAAPLCTARWEEGWDLPVAEWRRRLGILQPANDETYGLKLTEA
jgi:ubiquinone biosynthesis protein Coq4